MDKRKNNGGHPNSGRKKGIGISYDIQKYCNLFIEELLKDEAIKSKAIKQLSNNYKDIVEDYFYIIKNKGLYKIGYSSNWDKRFKTYKTHLGLVNVIYLTKQMNCFKLETDIHKTFNHCRMTGEWFDLTNEDLFKIIKFCSSKII